MSLLKNVFPSKNSRELRSLEKEVAKINALEREMQRLESSNFPKKTEEFKKRLANDESIEDIKCEAFALVREASVRTLKMRHFDVQLIGGLVLLSGRIAEMKTGEGKTLVATLTAYVRALIGKGCHLVTVNDHLAKRDATWMQPIYEILGMSVGFIVGGLSRPQRREAYACDITYGTNNEFGFDYLRDNMVLSLDEKAQRDHYFAIIDEVDSILIDEARTPLIISGPSELNTAEYNRVNTIVPKLTRGEVNEKGKEIPNTGDYVLDEKDKNILITETGVKRIEEILGIENLYAAENTDLLHHVNQALRAHKLYQRDDHYLVENSSVTIIDEFTGRKMEGRRFSNGLHQAIEAKEGVPILSENQTIATITLQNYFRLYNTISGMTGTADTEAEEFNKIYNLNVVVIPTNKPIIRKDHGDKIFKTEREKFEAIIEYIRNLSKRGQPVLIGTTSVEKSEKLSNMLRYKRIEHELLNAKQHEREAHIVEKAGQRSAVTIATNMAGRGTDIKLEDTVKEMGGLVILGSERHESRRIDNQLRGRSGRQGDPGESIFYLSLDDDLMRRFHSQRMAGILTKLGMKDGEEIEHPLISRQIENAQKKLEARNFEVRKHLLEYDDVINSQRKYIYQLRNVFLEGEYIAEKIDELIEDVCLLQIDFWRSQKSQQIFLQCEKWLLTQLHIEQNIFASAINKDIPLNTLQKKLTQLLKDTYDKKRAAIQPDLFTRMERFVVLQIIDTNWKEHLLNIDHLREGISLRSYGERKPLIEFKQEGFRLFEEMIASTQIDAVQILFSVRLRESVESEQKINMPHTKSVFKESQQQSNASIFASPNSSTANGSNPPPPPAAATLTTTKRIGRNDPCYCGSNKKYKHCHLKK